MEIQNLFLVLDRISHSFTCGICTQNNYNISKHPCIIFYIMETIWLILRLRYYMGINCTQLLGTRTQTYVALSCMTSREQSGYDVDFWTPLLFSKWRCGCLATSVNFYPEVRLSAIVVMIYIRFLAIVTFCKISSNPTAIRIS